MTNEEREKHLSLIGKSYVSKTAKRKDICTVVDCHFTFNAANELVKVRYVSEHELLGQKIRDNDVVAVTILRNEIKPA